MIEIVGLTKKYDALTAVDRLDLSIADGEIFGLLGPNGAGKTTTIRMLTTLASITGGRAIINGLDVEKSPIAVKKIIGLAPQGLNLEIELTAEENLEFHGRLHGMPARERRARIDELLDFAGIAEKRNELVSKLSGGMKRRLLIARAIMHRPKVLFLDEPTVGLDPQIRRKMWEMVLELKRGGITVFLTTHYIEEADFLCDRVGIMNRGRLAALNPPAALKEKTGRYAVLCRQFEGCKPAFFASREDAVRFASGMEEDVTIRHTTLEDVFIHLTGEAFE